MHEALLVARWKRPACVTKYLDKEGVQIWRGITLPAIPPDLACQPVVLALSFQRILSLFLKKTLISPPELNESEYWLAFPIPPACIHFFPPLTDAVSR